MRVTLYDFFISVIATLILSMCLPAGAIAEPIDVEVIQGFRSDAPLPEILSVEDLPFATPLRGFVSKVSSASFRDGPIIRGLSSTAIQIDVDPLLNLRYEIENLTDTQQFFSVHIKFATNVTLGATFNDTFLNAELIDMNNDGNATLFDSSSFFEVIDDPGGDLINGSATLGSAFFQSFSTAGQYSLFDNIGAGPNAEDFGGTGFNYFRFVTSGFLSAGDKLVLTGMGCYGTTETYCPERFEIPADYATVPVPAAVWLFGSALGLLGWMRRVACR